MTGHYVLPGCEVTIPAVDASSNSGVIAKLQNECVEGDASSTVVPEFSTPETSAPVNSPFVGKWWSSCWVRPDEVIKEEEALMEVDGKRLSSDSSLIVVKGQPKVGKTTFLQAYISALLLMNYGIFSASREDLKVVYVDTEQPRFHTLRGVLRVHNICNREGLDKLSDRFYTLTLRGENMETRFQIISETVDCVHPDVLVIDNVADLIADYNAVGESRTLVSKLVQLMEVYKCTIVVVIHTAKGNTFSLGTLGGDLEKKAEAIVLIDRKKNNVITCSVTTRNEPIEPFSLTLDEDNLPVFCDYVAPVKKQRSAEEKSVQKQDEAKARVEEFVTLLGLKTGTVYDYKMQAKLYSEKSGQSYKTGTRRIDEGVAIGSLELWDEYGFKKFRLNSTSANTSLPF